MKGFEITSPVNASSILGIPFLPGFGPGNTGAPFEQLLYAAPFGGYGFIEAIEQSKFDTLLLENFTNPANRNVITATSGTGGAAYETNGGLTLTTGSTSGGTASAQFNIASDKNFNGIDTLQLVSDVGLTFNTGAGEFAWGMTNSLTIPTNATTTLGAWFYITWTAGSATTYVCVADGSNVTATDVTGVIGTNPNINELSIVSTRGSSSIGSITFYSGAVGTSGSTLATITTNLPGENDILLGSQLWRAWAKTNDTTARSITLVNAKINISP